MKSKPPIPSIPHPQSRVFHPPAPVVALLLAFAPLLNLSAADDPQLAAPPANQPAAAAPAEKSPPLPLHQIEGSGGIFSTLSAYIVNPPRNGELVGRPSVGFSYISLGHDLNLEALTLTESPFKRLELGYGWDRLGLGDLPQVLGIQTHEVQLHNANARFQIFTEGEFDQKWLPALTAGVHFKYNDGISDVNDEVHGALANLAHVAHHEGTDFTLYGSKLFTNLPRPVLLELGGRATEAVWDGLGGFTGRYNYEFEGNLVTFVTPSLALAAEYKEQPRDYTAIGSVYRKESDWWTLDAAYVVNHHFTVAVGYGNFGHVLNHNANGVWGITTKFEF